MKAIHLGIFSGFEANWYTSLGDLLMDTLICLTRYVIVLIVFECFEADCMVAVCPLPVTVNKKHNVRNVMICFMSVFGEKRQTSGPNNYRENMLLNISTEGMGVSFIISIFPAFLFA
jgi:hypothetical protein